MIIFKDKFGESNDEVLSDVYKIEPYAGGVMLKVYAKSVTFTTEVSDAMIGGNASAEGGGDEGGDAATESGINVVLANKLVEMTQKKSAYKSYIKDHMKTLIDSVKETHPDEVDDIKKKISKFVMDEVIGGKDSKVFDDWQFFCGESMNPDGMLILCRWEDDGNPCMFYFKHGLIEEKV
jgi:hypothetical protein